MFRLAVNELTTFRWSFEQDVFEYAAAGFDGIGIWRQKLADFGEEAGRRLLHDMDLRVSSLMWAGGFTGSDGRSVRESLTDAFEALETAHRLQADCLVVYTGGRGGHTRKHARRLVKNSLLELADCASALGVTLAIEPMHWVLGANWTILNQLDEALDFLDEVGADIRLVFDSYHMAQSPAVLEYLPGIVDRIGLVQLGDARRPPSHEQDRCPLGHGRLPLQEIVTCLLESDYDGAIEVELLGQEIEDYEYSQLLAWSRQFLGEAARNTVELDSSASPVS